MISTIPFAGFYNSWHDQLLDDALASAMQNNHGDPNTDLVNHAFGKVNWHRAHVKYAEAFANEWLQLHGLTGRFVELSSPREYNFETDRIFVDIDESDLQRIFREVPIEVLDAKAAEMFTSCSGFISFYSPVVDNWDDFPEWDHNQLGCLVAAWSEWKDLMPEDEDELMSRYRDNGHLDDWVINTDPVIRLANIAEYLRRRQDREYRHITANMRSATLGGYVP